jgi:two-component system, chemotaxis family, CheB/CheR fusion protein
LKLPITLIFATLSGGEHDTLKPRGKVMSFPIVAIGASAGGLESISALLTGIPANTGMAYLFVQHLDPGHVSHLTKILSKRAALPVEEAREGEIFPDHLYVIIPNSTLTITSHVLHLMSRDPGQRPHRPVDILFLSLAESREPNVIGVILSGSGSDGAKGIQAIKEAGGITFAEEENSASFFGMPSSAIQTGCVDYILNPLDIAQGLIGISRQYRLQKAQNKLRVTDRGC